MKLEAIMDTMNYNLHNRNNGNQSILGDIEKQLIDVFVTTPNFQEKANDFESHLICSSDVLSEEKEKYSNVNGIREYFNETMAAKETELLRETAQKNKK